MNKKSVQNFFDKSINKRTILFILACIPFAVFMFMVFRASYESLCIYVHDDTFYYLQPAWRFKTHGFFTFDGLSSTYGWQPLWMMILSLLAMISPDKHVLLAGCVLLSVLFFCSAGFLLGIWVGRLTKSFLAGFIASFLWLINPALLDIYTSGKENGIHAFLLVLSLIVFDSMIKSFKEKNLNLSLSLLTGLMFALIVLARINAFAFAAAGFSLLIIRILIADRKKNLEPIFVVIGFASILIAWAIYAVTEFGTIMPSSGLVKLHDAGLNSLSVFGTPLFVKSIEAFIPVLDAGFVRYRFSVIFIFLASASYTYHKKSSLASFTDLKKQFNDKQKITMLLENYGSFILLLIYAIANHLSSFAVLNRWFFYGNWYHVPQQVLGTVIVALILGSIIISYKVKPALHTTALYSFFAMLMCLRLFAFFIETSNMIPPGEFRKGNGWSYESIQTVKWIRNNISPEARIGSWNAGLFGYYLDDHTVINLDGLANSVDFVPLLYDDDKLREYIKDRSILYLVDTERPSEIANNRYRLFGEGEFAVEFASGIIETYDLLRIYVVSLNYDQ